MKKLHYSNLFSYLTAFIFTFFIFKVEIQAQQLFTKYNLDFEIGNIGRPAPGWTMTKTVQKLGYTFELTQENKTQGKKALKLTHDGKQFYEDMYGSVQQSLDAVPFRGRKIVFSADVYLENIDDTSKVFLWIHEHYSDGSKGQFVVSAKDSLKESGWQRLQVELNVANLVDFINYGFYLDGKGILYADNASLEVISPFEKPQLPSIILSEQQIDLLYDYTKIFGNIAFFDPLESTFESDKFSMLYDGTKKILDFVNKHSTTNSNVTNITEKDIVDFYKNLLTPIDSNIYVFNPLKESAPKIDKNKGRDLLSLVSGRAYSNLSYGAYNNKYSVAAHTIAENIFSSQRGREGSILQVIDFAKLKLKKPLNQITIEAKAKLKKYQQGTNAQIWTRIDVEGQKESLSSTMKDKPFTDSIWTGIKITIKTPAKANALRIGLVLEGDGEVLFDDIKVSGLDQTQKTIIFPIKNADFEQKTTNNLPLDWDITQNVLKAGYQFEVVTDPIAHSSVLKISTNKDELVITPSLNQFITSNINDSLSIYFPINIEENEISNIKYDYPFPIVEINDKDVLSRLVNLMYTTALFNQFSQTKISKNSFSEYAQKVCNQMETKDEFEKILSSFITQIKDSGIRVWNPDNVQKYAYPFLLKYSNGNVYISFIPSKNRIKEAMIDFTSAEATTLSPNNDKTKHISAADLLTKTFDINIIDKLKVGYQVKSINGVDISDIISSEKSYTSGVSENFIYSKILANLRTTSNFVVIDNIEFIDFEGNIINLNIPKAFLINLIYEERPAPVVELTPDILYVDMTRVSDEMFKYYLSSIQEFKYILFDLRGLSLMSEYFLGYFTGSDLHSYTMEQQIFTTPLESSTQILNKKVYKQNIPSLKDKIKAVPYFLTNETTIGYSELIANTIKKNHLGTIIGDETAGGNAETATLRLPCDYLISFPTFSVFDESGYNITAKPILPDIKINYDFKNNIDDNGEIDNDYFIKYAVDYIKSIDKK